MLSVLQKVKKVDKLVNSEAGQKALPDRTPNPTEMGTQHQTSFLREFSLEVSAVGN